VLKLKSITFGSTKVNTLVIPVCEDSEIYAEKAIISAVKMVRELKEFNGKKEDAVTLYGLPMLKAERTIFLGLGEVKKINPEILRSIAGQGVKKCIRMGLSEVIFAVPLPAKIKLEMALLLEAMSEGACLGNHLFDKYKKEKTKKSLKNIFLNLTPGEKRRYANIPPRVEAICQGTGLARDWVSMPPNDKRPEQFSKLIVARARKENLRARVLGEKELKQKKFGALLAVAAGSRSKPRLVILEYRPKAAKKTIAFVGKGVTFDSGGINIKPSASLDDMKMDMSGAAAVAATLITIAKLKPKVNVIGAIPIVENMPSGDASRPGDIIRSHDGKTVEIGNTDAEGRLILIDAMSYVQKQYKPQVLIDLATLTGACIVALGEKIAGVFSTDDELAGAIVASGERMHERCWRMPLPEDYKELLKSDFADINNMSTSRWGGAITAALFLSEFVKEARWAHIDIAGPAYVKKASAYCDAGGTGFGVRLLCDLLGKL